MGNVLTRTDLSILYCLCAIRETASPPLTYTHNGTFRAKKAPLVWSCRKTPEGELIKDLLLPTPPRTWCWRAGGQLKTWATTIKSDLEPISGPRVFGHARWRQDWVKVSSELAQDRRDWSGSVRDVINAIGDAGSTRPGWMPTQVQVSTSEILKVWKKGQKNTAFYA